uniref:Uncharacterized protein n=1 Tax=Panagrolaimus superbus TaxID=310955 RepID=A0A914XZ04_9BILA
MAVNIQMANTSFDVYNNDPSSLEHSDAKKSGAFENTFSYFRRNSSKSSSSASSDSKEEEHAKKTLFGKILRILSLKVSESKVNEKSRKHFRQRRRSSASSTSFQPMPTIYEEENEAAADLYSMQSSFNQTPNHSIIAVA